MCQNSVNIKTRPKNIQFFISLWRTSTSCNQVDIVFDMYKENSIKASEQRQRMAVEGIETITSGFDQPLPAEIDRFWSVSKNKTALQQHFTMWTLNKVKLNNFKNCYSYVVCIKKTMRCVLALSMGWLVLKGYLNAHTKGLMIKCFPCKSHNKDRKLWKCCYCISWHQYICIHNKPFLQTEVLWSGRIMVCFRSRKFHNILPLIWSRQWFRFGLCWSSTSNPCPHWMWYILQKLVQKAELSGIKLMVTTYCTHLARMHCMMKWLLMLRSLS